MEATQLMIGNLVKPIKPRHGEKFIIIESINFDFIFSGCKDYKLCEIEPLPITEEALNRLGFEMVGMHLWQKDNCIIEESIQDDSYYLGFRGGAIEFRHIHYLQNLYFHLSGKQLEFEY